MATIQADLITLLENDTYGLGLYSGSPTKPQMITTVAGAKGVNSAKHSVHSTRRVILVHPATFPTERVDSGYFENRGYRMKCTVISFSAADLENIYVDMKKVIDKYNQAPWAVDGVTYDSALISEAVDNSDQQGKLFILDCFITLIEQFVAVNVTLA
jgi:hypothetical protein